MTFTPATTDLSTILFEIAGRFSAHIVWTVSELKKGTFTPLIVGVASDRQVTMHRLLNTKPNEIRAKHREWIGWVIIDESTIKDGDTTVPAILASLYDRGGRVAVVAIPYRRRRLFNAMKLREPRIAQARRELQTPGIQQELLAAFWSGTRVHEKGFKIWQRHGGQHAAA